jgi:hypothetical protein
MAGVTWRQGLPRLRGHFGLVGDTQAAVELDDAAHILPLTISPARSTNTASGRNGKSRSFKCLPLPERPHRWFQVRTGHSGNEVYLRAPETRPFKVSPN